jgi:tripartite-type tricarboxylate transporter receptor subunit TctC
MARANIARISYSGGGAALIDLLGNHVHLMFNTGTAAPHVKAGRLRALAITSAQPSPLYPGLPTVAASGVPGYQAISVDGMFVPAKTPEGIIKRLNQEIASVIGTAEVRERLLSNGVEAISSSPDDLAAIIKSEVARLGKLIKDAGIREE